MQATALLDPPPLRPHPRIPFFGPLHDPGARLTVRPAQPKASLKDALHAAVQPPVFPIHMEQFRGELITVTSGRGLLHRLGQGDGGPSRTRAPPGFPDRGGGPAVAYMSDHQAPLDRRTIPDARARAVPGVDLLVHDGQYTDDEFSTKADWGHSTAAYAVHVAAESGATRLLLSHHDPSHTDRELDRILTRPAGSPRRRRSRTCPSARRVPVDRPRQGIGGSSGLDQARFREVLGHFATGVTIVTALEEG